MVHHINNVIEEYRVNLHEMPYIPHIATSAMFFLQPLHFTEITLSRMTVAPAAIFCAAFQQSFPKYNRKIGNVFCFYQSLHSVTVYSTQQVVFVIDLRVKNIFDGKIHVRVHPSVWLAACLVASL
jgi:hypothetical protein